MRPLSSLLNHDDQIRQCSIVDPTYESYEFHLQLRDFLTSCLKRCVSLYFRLWLSPMHIDATSAKHKHIECRAQCMSNSKSCSFTNMFVEYHGHCTKKTHVTVPGNSIIEMATVYKCNILMNRSSTAIVIIYHSLATS